MVVGVDLVNESMLVSNEASAYFNKIVNEIQNSSDFSVRISGAIKEQKQSIEQITKAMNEVNSGAQNTANVSENLSSNVEILKIHAEKLQRLLAG